MGKSLKVISIILFILGIPVCLFGLIGMFAVLPFGLIILGCGVVMMLPFILPKIKKHRMSSNKSGGNSHAVHYQPEIEQIPSPAPVDYSEFDIEDYEKLVKLFSRIDDFHSIDYLDRYNTIDKFINLSHQFPVDKFDYKIVTDSECITDTLIKHPTFGLLSGKNNYLNTLRERLINEQNEISSYAKSELKFETNLENIPLTSISKAIPPFKGTYSLSNFPEIKFSPVGPSFSRINLMNFVSVDVETTGLNASRNEIIQLSAIKFEDFEPVCAFNTYIKPHHGLQASAQKVNGITDSMVSDAPFIEEVMSAFSDFCGTFPIIGYNLAFDLKFLYMSGFPFDVKRKYYDILKLSKKYVKNLESYTLDSVCERFKIYRRSQHNSLSDAYACALVLDRVLNYI